MTAPKQVHLNLNLQTAGRHDAAWKRQEDTDRLASDADWYIRVAQLAEKGKLDAIFLADSYGSLLGESARRPWRGLDPTVLLSAIARETNHIGLVSTVHAIYGHPFSVARSIASLDHVSKGRAAWNIITSQNPPTLQALGRDETLDHDTRYRKADEFVKIVTGLWDSLPLVLDAELPYDRFDEADAGNTLEARRREQLVTEARTKGLTVRRLLFNNLSGGQRVIVGTPEQVADDIVDWVDSGACDGFNINIDVQTEGLEQFIDGVVAELQARGRFRRDYEYETFRENLGVA